MKEIFKTLAIKLIEDIGDNEWMKSTLFIMRLVGTVQFSATYVDYHENEIDLEVNFGFLEAKIVHKLYELTQTQPPIHTNWNRAKYTLFPDGKMEIEYIWDEELQNEVDKLNSH